MPPRPWVDAGTDTFPWAEEAFSRRMLAEHLCQDHAAASRPLAVIRGHVEDLIRLLGLQPGQEVLDLTCGPGLYCHELARRGFECVGIDWAPEAIRHARRVALEEGLSCQFEQQDVRTIDFPEQFDAVIFLYHQFQTFAPPDGSKLLRLIAGALCPGGRLLLELKPEEQSRETFAPRQTWRVGEPNLLCAGWHLELYEAHFDEASRTEIDQWHIVSLQDGTLTEMASALRIYTEDEIRGLLRTTGFAAPVCYQSWPTVPGAELLAVATKPKEQQRPS